MIDRILEGKISGRGVPTGLKDEQFFESAPEGQPPRVAVSLEMATKASDRVERLAGGCWQFRQFQPVTKQVQLGSAEH